MRKRHWMGMGLLGATIGGSSAMAQVPAAPAAPAAAAPVAEGAVGAAAGAGGFFKKCCDAIDECRRKICKTPAGALLNGMTAPVTALTGGVIPPFCPIMPSAKDLAQPGVAGAADMAKKDALEAKARREAVKYLGTLDCRYYPEAEAALIAALRADRVECVRLEAAIAFANGCCCTKKVMEALEICVSGSERDGLPSERSERVRDIASIALSKCVACYREAPVEVTPEQIDGNKEKPPMDKERPVPNITKLEKELLERSKKTLAMYQAKREGGTATVATSASIPRGQRSLFHIIKYSAEGSTPSQQIIMSQPQPQQDGIFHQPPVAIPATRVNVPAPTQTIPAPTPMPREMPQVKASPYTQIAPMPQAHLLPPVDDMKPMQATDPTAVKPPLANTEAEVKLPMVDPTPAVAPMSITLPMPEEVKPMTLTLPGEELKPQTLNLPQPGEESKVKPATATVTTDAVKPMPEGVSNLIDDLLTGTTANDRHQALRGLAEQDWKKCPQIVAGLVKAARLDSDRSVRVNAIRHLASMKMDVPYVMDHLKYMQKDSDEWVAQESTAALEKLQAAK